MREYIYPKRLKAWNPIGAASLSDAFYTHLMYIKLSKLRGPTKKFYIQITPSHVFVAKAQRYVYIKTTYTNKVFRKREIVYFYSFFKSQKQLDFYDTHVLN